MAPTYDASDPSPSTEAEMSTFQDIVEDAAWKNIECRLDPRAMHPDGPRKYVRSALVAGTDIKTYDVGAFILATNDGASATGKLWVDYDVELYVPHLYATTDTGVPQQTDLYTQHATQTFTTGTPAALAWDTNIFDPLVIGAGSSGIFTPPQGVYRIETQCSFADSTSELWSAQTELLKNGSSLSKVIKSRVAEASIAGNSGALSCVLMGVISCNGTDTFQIQVTLSGAAGTLTAVADESQMIVSLC